jgi:hypothetical protein
VLDHALAERALAQPVPRLSKTDPHLAFTRPAGSRALKPDCWIAATAACLAQDATSTVQPSV